MRALVLVLAAALTTSSSAAAQQRNTHEKVFDAITAAQTSAPLRNVAQSMHLLACFFPSEVSAVSSLQIRLEASFDATTYVPISDDITSVPAVGGIVYKIVVAYGTYPYVRARSLTGTGGKLLTCYYTGTPEPVVSVIQQASDRFVL